MLFFICLIKYFYYKSTMVLMEYINYIIYIYWHVNNMFVSCFKITHIDIMSYEVFRISVSIVVLNNEVYTI